MLCSVNLHNRVLLHNSKYETRDTKLIPKFNIYYLIVSKQLCAKHNLQQIRFQWEHSKISRALRKFTSISLIRKKNMFLSSPLRSTSTDPYIKLPILLLYFKVKYFSYMEFYREQSSSRFISSRKQSSCRAPWQHGIALFPPAFVEGVKPQET